MFIREYLSLSEWHHISTDLNPADHALRGLWINDDKNMRHWLGGPQFLYHDKSNWPKEVEIPGLSSKDPELKREITTHLTCQVEPGVIETIINSCSSWQKLLRRIAWLIRFVYVFKAKCSSY